MRAAVAAGGGFLLAVLWFDLMFDVQVRRYGGERLPDDVLASISTYYRRVTTEARPMNRLIAAVMVATLGVIVAEIAVGTDPGWLGWAALVVAAAAIGRAATGTVPNAVRLGCGSDPPEVRSRLARSIYRDHRACFAAIAVLVALQVAVR
jgi:hypothetical protein